jgi:outer membrane protein assembly factor BamC
MNASRRFVEISLSLLIALALSSCSSIARLFPDKQKQYQFSSDIPPLEIPPDLTATSIEDPATKNTGDASGVNYTDYVENSRKAPEPEEPLKESEPAASAEAPGKGGAPSQLAEKDKEAAHIEVHAPFPVAWNQVAKALGRLEIEITDQNRSDRTYFVYYREKATPKTEDGGFFSDIASIFKREVKDQEFRVQLEDRGEETSVYVLDTEGKPQSDGAGFTLLQALHHELAAADASK